MPKSGNVSYFLATYAAPDGLARAGLVVAGRLYDVRQLLGEESAATTLGILDAWERRESQLAAAAAEIERGHGAADGKPIDAVTLLAPILYPGQIFGAGANYNDHLEEMVRAEPATASPNLKAIGEDAWHYIKASRSCVVGPHAAIPLPEYSNAVDWEIELAVIIGRPARNVSIEHALEYVAGYTVANDVSVRDSLSRRKLLPPSSPFYRDWVASKGFEGACPLGPWIAPATQIPDPQALALRLWLNGELMQNSNTSSMIFTVAEQLSALSRRLTLHPGDVILTGTPAGVGAGRGRFLRSGDALRLWIEGIGELQHVVA